MSATDSKVDPIHIPNALTAISLGTNASGLLLRKKAPPSVESAGWVFDRPFNMLLQMQVSDPGKEPLGVRWN
jgi:hypothetical protein